MSMIGILIVAGNRCNRTRCKQCTGLMCPETLETRRPFSWRPTARLPTGRGGGFPSERL